MPEAICCFLHGGSIRTCRPITILQPKTQQQQRQRACNPQVSLPEPFTFSGPPMDPPFRALSDRVRTGPERRCASEHCRGGATITDIVRGVLPFVALYAMGDQVYDILRSQMKTARTTTRSRPSLTATSCSDTT